MHLIHLFSHLSSYPCVLIHLFSHLSSTSPTSFPIIHKCFLLFVFFPCTSSSFDHPCIFLSCFYLYIFCLLLSHLSFFYLCFSFISFSPTCFSIVLGSSLISFSGTSNIFLVSLSVSSSHISPSVIHLLFFHLSSYSHISPSVIQFSSSVSSSHIFPLVIHVSSFISPSPYLLLSIFHPSFPSSLIHASSITSSLSPIVLSMCPPLSLLPFFLLIFMGSPSSHLLSCLLYVLFMDPPLFPLLPSFLLLSICAPLFPSVILFFTCPSPPITFIIHGSSSIYYSPTSHSMIHVSFLIYQFFFYYSRILLLFSHLPSIIPLYFLFCYYFCPSPSPLLLLLLLLSVCSSTSPLLLRLLLLSIYLF